MFLGVKIKYVTPYIKKSSMMSILYKYDVNLYYKSTNHIKINLSEGYSNTFLKTIASKYISLCHTLHLNIIPNMKLIFRLFAYTHHDDCI